MSASSSFRVPWGSWFGDRERTFRLPAGWHVETCGIRGCPPLSLDAIDAALDVGHGGPPLAELAAGRANAVVAVEDISRPADLATILPRVLRRIHDAGVPPERTRILIGVGGHAPLDRPLLLKKLGRAVLDRYDVANHHPYENLVDLGTSDRGLPIRVNRTFVESDLKLAVGSVVPHPYAGFGGGAKIVLPGLAGIDTLEANHRPAVTGLRGGLDDVETNTARREMEEVALRVGLEAIVNVVTDDRRRTVGVFAGHPVIAHRAAVALARRAYATPPPPAPVDVAVLNAYPKDTELLQVGNVFNVLRSGAGIPVRPGGTVVVVAACSLGRGYHALHGPDMRLYRRPVEKSYLEGRGVIVHSPNLSEADARVSFWDGYAFERTWSGVVARLKRLHGTAARAVVFPCAPLQLLEGPARGGGGRDAR